MCLGRRPDGYEKDTQDRQAVWPLLGAQLVLAVTAAHGLVSKQLRRGRGDKTSTAGLTRGISQHVPGASGDHEARGPQAVGEHGPPVLLSDEEIP